MCPFCISTAAWIAAGIVSTGSVSALAAVKIWNKKTREPEQQQAQGGSHDNQ
ncbi:hypothetical protein [Terracidiphilus gabretensis]|uniref:hypothetical protein n=1 Tax=Terracidiphilus gabretensis TaxID=1577687 RepID=UPI0012FAB843|nr:hypothetical protein [Terracidiphilus gabretensis]